MNESKNAPATSSGKLRRTPQDGPIGVDRDWRDDSILLSATHDGKPQSLRVTEWNARRLLGALSVMLGLPLSKAASKQVEM